MSVSLELIRADIARADWLHVQDATSKKKADGTPESLDVARVRLSPGPRSVAGLISVSS